MNMEKIQRENNGEKFKVICPYCRKEVEVSPVAYGGGFIATCPECGKLAYNGDNKPSSLV